MAAPTKCKAPWRFVKIDTDGRVLPCYRAWEAISMGKVYDDGVPFADIWNNERYRELRRTVNDDAVAKSFPYCARCDYRYGWGDLRQHLGFEHWAETVAPALPSGTSAIDHRRDRHDASRPPRAPGADVLVP
jgi:radical SAM protein with 4Fe4S-binding SPASM domain